MKFINGRPFQPSLMSVSKARVSSSDTLINYMTHPLALKGTACQGKTFKLIMSTRKLRI